MVQLIREHKRSRAMNTVTLLTEEQIRAIVGDAVRSAVSSEMDRKQPNPQHSGLFTIKQAQERMQITRPTIYKWLKEGRLKAYRIGGRVFLKEAEVMSALQPVRYTL